mgnify:CR=1 FL=1
MKIKTADLIEPALDWAVAKCEGVVYESFMNAMDYMEWRSKQCLDPNELAGAHHAYQYSTKWACAGPLIEREGIYLRANDMATEWAAGALRKNRLDKKPGPLFYAKTPLIAAMRCFVASKLGDEIEIPEELL